MLRCTSLCIYLDLHIRSLQIWFECLLQSKVLLLFFKDLHGLGATYLKDHLFLCEPILVVGQFLLLVSSHREVTMMAVHSWWRPPCCGVVCLPAFLVEVQQHFLFLFSAYIPGQIIIWQLLPISPECLISFHGLVFLVTEVSMLMLF